jgi:hypothetical protein
LQHRASQALISNRLYLSLDEKRGSGHIASRRPLFADDF